MDTNRLKHFATEARKRLMQGVVHRLIALGFRPNGSVTEEPQLQGGGATFMGGIVSQDFYEKWISLHEAVQQRSVDEIVEEAAYTWFNRLVATQIMVRNRLILPVLDFEESGARVPVIVAEARQGRCPQMDDDTRRQLNVIIDDDRKTAEQFTLLITAFCHSNPVLYSCFGHIKDYTEMLLPIDILAEQGFVSMLNETEFIADEDYKSPELIGWLYQFYISDRKDEVMSKKGKYTPDEIPAATQIFTPNWIVKYMVQNTVGRIYLDNNPDAADELKPQWKFLVDNQDDHNIDNVLNLNLEDMKVADLACGSGHILNESFDMLYDLYVAEGYSRRQAIENIFSKNLTGIDIDTRAKQLATFALLLKACQKDSSFIDAHSMPHVLDMPHVDRYTWKDLGGHLLCALDIRDWKAEIVNPELNECFKLMEHAGTLGSIMKFDISTETRTFIKTCIEEQNRQQKYVQNFAELFKGFELILALTEKYSALITNPPYLGLPKMNDKLKEYVSLEYNEGRHDLFSVFLYASKDRLCDKGLIGYICPYVWMFISSYEVLRNYILNNYVIKSLIQLEYNAFEPACVPVATFVLKQGVDSSSGVYVRLVDFKGAQNQAPKVLEALANPECEWLYKSNQSHFKKVNGAPIVYWFSDKFFRAFEYNSLESLCTARKGMYTGENALFVRIWHEVDYHSTSCFDNINPKWRLYANGGGYRKWGGYIEDVVYWKDNGAKLRRIGEWADYPSKAGCLNLEFIDRVGAFWTAISNITLSARYLPSGVLFSSAANAIFDNEIDDYFVLASLNNVCAGMFLKGINPTLNYNAGDVIRIPCAVNNFYDRQSLSELAMNCVSISNEDWDAHETSWGFTSNEIVGLTNDKYRSIWSNSKESHGSNIPAPAPKFDSFQWRLKIFKMKWETMFDWLQSAEEVLNHRFINLYGLQNELSYLVPMDDITILQQGEISIENYEIIWHDDVIVKQFISYAVGCMMGRYSIDKPGLILANKGEGMKEFEAQVPNSRFEVDDDGIIPLMPSDTWFNDNATLRFKRFVETVFGPSRLNENLNFIEQALSKSIDNYFIKDFWKDHVKMYQKRPIYWLFSSKKGAFQCLVYMHRMNAYTAERIRAKYLLPHIEWLVQRAQELEKLPVLNAQERRALDSLNKQIAECREYHDRLHVIADRQIDFDLDDGVVVNYAKFGDVLAKLK